MLGVHSAHCRLAEVSCEVTKCVSTRLVKLLVFMNSQLFFFHSYMPHYVLH